MEAEIEKRVGDVHFRLGNKLPNGKYESYVWINFQHDFKDDPHADEGILGETFDTYEEATSEFTQGRLMGKLTKFVEEHKVGDKR